MKKLTKIFFTFSFVLLLLAGGVFGYFYLNRQKLLRQFIEEVNQNLATEIRVKTIHVSIWSFPFITIELSNVYVEDTFAEKNALLEAERIRLTLSLWDALKKKYFIRNLLVENGKIHAIIKANGENNYTIWKKNETKSDDAFSLSEISLQACSLELQQERWKTDVQIFLPSYIVHIPSERTLHILGEGAWQIDALKADSVHWLTGKPIQTKFDITVADSTFVCRDVAIDLDQIKWRGQGKMSSREGIDFTLRLEKTAWQKVINLVPKKYSASLQKYRVSGDVAATLHVKGDAKKQRTPSLDVSFGFQRASVTYEKNAITESNLQGTFHADSLGDWRGGALTLHSFTGKWNAQPFRSTLAIQNFNNPYVRFSFDGEIEPSFFSGWTSSVLDNLTGRVKASLLLQGNWNKIKTNVMDGDSKISGDATLTDISFHVKDQPIEVKKFSGHIQFTQQDVLFTDLRGELNHSDVALSGSFKNIFPYFFSNQTLHIQTRLQSKRLDLTEFPMLIRSSPSDNGGTFLSPRLRVDIAASVAHLSYKKFSGRKVNGRFLLQDKMATLQQFDMETLGGKITCNAIVETAQLPYSVDAHIKTTNLALDSVFYVFDNFEQPFLQAKNLKGKTTADVRLFWQMDAQGKWKPETFVGDLSIEIKNGELIQFEPIQKLKKYVEEDALSRLVFADLKNDIHIEKGVIYIPPMEIKTNATTIQLSGTHGFDQKIDYRIVAPLRNKKKADSDDYFGAVEQDKGQTKLFLKITGTTSNYDVALDKSAVKKKISNDIKKEVQELKDAFKKKQKKKTIELNQEETFDWD